MIGHTEFQAVECRGQTFDDRVQSLEVGQPDFVVRIHVLVFLGQDRTQFGSHESIVFRELGHLFFERRELLGQ